MSETNTSTDVSLSKRMGVFERYLTLWVALCMGLGIGLGKLFPPYLSILLQSK